MSEWKEYDGSDEQIAEIESAFLKSGFIVMSENGNISEVIQGTQQLSRVFVLYNFKQAWGVKRYLICNPHPRADMICQQAITGQPVWIKIKLKNNTVPNGYANHPCLVNLSLHRNCAVFKKSKNIEWDLVDAEYSFTEFEG